jgi:hypothetical protein
MKDDLIAKAQELADDLDREAAEMGREADVARDGGIIRLLIARLRGAEKVCEAGEAYYADDGDDVHYTWKQWRRSIKAWRALVDTEEEP